MQFALTFVFLLMLQAPPAESPTVKVSTLNGNVVTGKMALLDSAGVAFESGPEKLPLDQVLSIDFPGEKATPAAPPLVVFGAQGSRFACQSYVAVDREATLTLPGGEKIRLPLDQVAGVLWKETDKAEAIRKFEESLKRRTADRLIVLREGKQFTLDGILGPANDDGLTFIVDGEELPVKRDRVYPMVYASKGEPREAQATILDRAGNVWVADEVEFREGAAQLRLAAGAPHRLAAGCLPASTFRAVGSPFSRTKSRR